MWLMCGFLSNNYLNISKFSSLKGSITVSLLYSAQKKEFLKRKESEVSGINCLSFLLIKFYVSSLVDLIFLNTNVLFHLL